MRRDKTEFIRGTTQFEVRGQNKKGKTWLVCG